MGELKKRTDYLTDLKRWQAYSHLELANSKPEELFQVPFVRQYLILRQDIMIRVLRVHGTLLTLDQLLQFPFDFIYGPFEMEFWRLVILNFADMAILLLHGLANDKGADVHSLESFKDEIVQAAWLCPSKHQLFMQVLNERKFNKRVKSIAERVDKIRDNRLAHRLKDTQTRLPKEGFAAVTLEELWDLFDAVHSLSGGLSFGSTYVTLAGDMIPSWVRGEPSRNCLDGILDAVLRQSDVVNAPERLNAPEKMVKLWPMRRKHMNPEELRVLNELRNRIGLPEA